MLFLEFDVPRLGSRIDAALVTGPAVFVIEFKCGEKRFTTDAYNQAWDYGLDLKNFHQASHEAPIFPLVVATAATSGDDRWAPAHADGVRPPRRTTPNGLRGVIDEALLSVPGPHLDGDIWGRAPYQPTPTIIEAARALYSGHCGCTYPERCRREESRDHCRHGRGHHRETRARREKVIAFVTGVPGAGKTLVGLNVATRRHAFGKAPAVFLSGNGPLVAVLQEALTRDEWARQNRAVRKGHSAEGKAVHPERPSFP